MGRNIKGSSGDFNERVMLAMYASDCLNIPERQHYFLTGRGLAYLLGGAWSSYRHNQMMALEKQGAVICLKIKRGREQWHYALTVKGYSLVDQLVTEARKGAFGLNIIDAKQARDNQLSLFEKVGI